MNLQIDRLPAVKAASGLARSTIYLKIADRLWTRPVALGARAVGWPRHEVDALVAARIAGVGDDGIRRLVARLEAERASALQRLTDGTAT